MTNNILPNKSIFDRTESFLQILPLESLLRQDMQENPTYIGQTLKKIAAIFNENHIAFAVAGALSLGIRAKPRYTIDIDVLVHPDDYGTVENLVKRSDLQILVHDEYLLTVKDVHTGVEIDVLFSPYDPEESARATATVEEIFGVRIPVIQSEYLLWMYLLSDQAKHKVDGIHLIQSGHVNLEKLSQYLQYDGDEHCLETLRKWSIRAAQEQQRSYSQTVRQRKSFKTKSSMDKSSS